MANDIDLPTGRADADAGSTDGMQDRHACPICRKQFDRKDLRDRHRRRCVKSIGRVRPLRKKACERCIASKLKCNYEKPSCSRCLSRSVACQYSLGIGHVETNINALETQMPGRREAEFPTDVTALASSFFDDGDGDTLGCDGLPPQDDVFDYEWGNFDVLREVDNAFLEDEPGNINAIDTGGLGFGSTTDVLNGKEPELNTDLATRDFGDSKEGSASLSTPFSLHVQTKSILEPADRFAQLIARSLAAAGAERKTRAHTNLTYSTGRLQVLYPGMFSLGEVARLVGEYPARMLEPTFNSPFIHPMLCRKRPGGPPAPLAVAFACVGMKLHMEKEGMGFVCETMSQETDKLIKRLPSVLGNREEACVVLQALCIYSIEALISADRYPSRLNSAVLHHEYLIRATKRLLQQIANTAPDGRFGASFLASPHTTVDWKTWIVEESLRRTLFLLYITHELLHVAETLDHAYFEPLFAKGEGDVYESIMLPSADDLWQAQGENEWRHAMGQQQLQPHTTPMQQLPLGIAERRVSGGDEAWMLAEFPHLTELTRLILSIGTLYGAVLQCTHPQPILSCNADLLQISS